MESSALVKYTKTHCDDTLYTNQIIFSFMKKAKEMCTTSGLHSSTLINAIELYTIDANSISVLVNYLNSTKISNVEI